MGLLRALALVPDTTLLVIGDGPLRRKAEKLSQRLGLQSRVTFAGWLPSQKQVVSALSSARMFVMNSRSEGGPRVALEAMACGLPVIATSVGVMPEVIRNGENGVLIPMQTRALTDAITLLRNDAKLRDSMAHEAAKGIERFERKAAIETYARFISSLA
jgi:glycosyltransferase involved in cell wall biosynthesis